MKILFVTDLYPIGNENIAKALFYFVQEWKNLGHDVDVIRSNFIFNTKVRGRKIIKEELYIENGIKIYNLNFISPFLFNVRRKLPKDFSLYNYDVIISHMPCGALMAKRLLEKEKIKYICSVHSSDIVVLKDFKYSIYFRKQLKEAYLIADKISARSPVLQKKIEQVIPEIQEKTFVAYSGIEDCYINNKKIKNFDYETLQICTVSSLIKRKNIDVIIKALSKLQGNFHFTIIGEGKEKKSLQKLSEKLKISDKTTFLGKLKRENVINEMKKNDIFILLSDNETFGLSYVEAMASGNIVIAKKGDGIDGILQNGQNAFLIEKNPEKLKECIEMIFSLKQTEIEKIITNAISTANSMTSIKASENYLRNIYIR